MNAQLRLWLRFDVDAGVQDRANELIAQALTLLKEDFAYIPLHQQVVVWATRDSVDLAQTGDNFFQLRFVKLK